MSFFYRESKWLTIVVVLIPAIALLLAVVVPAISRWLGGP
jgi:hypothetical protein